MKTNNNKGDKDQDALALFNEVKDAYAQKIEELTDLKKELFKAESIDQQQKSKLRITIESLLIDLNEEIFSISEELAKSYTFEKQKNILSKAQDFQQRKKLLLKKIKESIDENPSVKIIRRSARISNTSPPQRDFNTLGPIDDSVINHFDSPKISTTKASQHKKYNFSEVFPSEQNQNSVRKQQQQQDRSLKKKKSPTPLRRKEINNSFNIEQKSGRSRQESAKKQLFQQETEGSKNSRNKGSKTRKQSKRLEEFEKYLAKKNGPSNKENSKAQNSSKLEKEHDKSVQYQPTLQSEVFEIFSQEFAHMKNKILQMSQKQNEQEEKSKTLEDQVEKLKTDNLKLTTDIKIIRGEHSEILHTLYTLEKKNNQLQQENQVLKRIVQGERDMKGQESNMPKPYQDQFTQNPGDISIQETQQRQRSPFTSILQKNRSFSQL